MKKSLSILLAAVMLLACVNIAPITAHAAKAEKKRAIAVVFDNSASMYKDGDKTWCRATYAMEVFASMLNDKDVLNIYPMNPIEVNGKTYSMDAPLTISNPKEATEKVHNIFSPHSEPATRSTPIESIDRAIAGLEQMSGDERHLIILTDGDVFYENNKDLSKSQSKSKLESRIQIAVGKSGITKVWYLGIKPEKEKVIMPNINSPKFHSEEAKESTEILSILTEMCNGIFGRDLLPSGYLSGKEVKFDVSVKNVFVFVQGTDIANLQLKDKNGKEVTGKQLSLQPKFSQRGSGLEAKYNANAADDSLQGMLVRYENCDIGDYTVSFSGAENAQNGIQVYYEPDVDLNFEFRTASGKEVDLSALYEGDYTVSYGLKDNKTKNPITSKSPLLGNTKYTVSYTHNGETKTLPIKEDITGEFNITLELNDTFEAELTAEYLNEYTITKSSSEFGFPKGGVKIVARPAADLNMNIEGGQEKYSLQKLKEGEPFKLTFFYGDKQLTGDELKKVELSWEEGASKAAIKTQVENDHILLSLDYTDPDNPQSTKDGSSTVPLTAIYTAKGSTPSQTQGTLRYYIDNDFSPLWVDMYAQESYIVIKDMGNAPPVVVEISIDGKPLTAEQFQAVKPSVDCGGLENELKAEQEKSRYLIYLKQDDNAKEGDYILIFTAEYTDKIGRTTSQEVSIALTLSRVELWKKVLNWIIWILLAILLIILICRIPAMPSARKTGVKDGDAKLTVAAKQVEATFDAGLGGGELFFETTYAGRNFGITVSDLKPGPKSFISTPLDKRSILVSSPEAVTKTGNVNMTEISVAGTKFVFDNASHSFVPASPKNLPFTITHGDMIRYQGTITINGSSKTFQAKHRITFK